MTSAFATRVNPTATLATNRVDSVVAAPTSFSSVLPLRSVRCVRHQHRRRRIRLTRPDGSVWVIARVAKNEPLRQRLVARSWRYAEFLFAVLRPLLLGAL